MAQPQGFFALCRPPDGVTVKHLALSNDVQKKMTELFAEQHKEFIATFSTVIPWNGDWKPDDDEALSIDHPEAAKVMVQSASASSLAVESLNPKKFEQERVKAIFTGQKKGAHTTVLVQKFSAQQLLQRKFNLLLAGSVFTELTEPGFSLDTQLACVIEGGKVIFKSFHKVRSIFDLSQFYREATDQEIKTFCEHKHLHHIDLDQLKAAADQGVRKLIHRVLSNGVLDKHSVDKIKKAAGAVGVAIVVKSGKIVLPSERSELKAVLGVLDDDIYEAPLTRDRYVTNSKKPVS